MLGGGVRGNGRGSSELTRQAPPSLSPTARLLRHHSSAHTTLRGSVYQFDIATYNFCIPFFLLP